MLLILIFSLVLGLPQAQPKNQSTAEECPKEGGPGLLSVLGVRLCFQNFDKEQRSLEISSPDSSIVLAVNGREGNFQTRGRNVGTLPVGRDTEILWSPDSKALIVTDSYGASGPTSAYIKVVPSMGIADVPDPVQLIKKDFAMRHPKTECSDSVNVGGLGWLEGSRKALLVGQIPPTSHCGPMWGYFDVYVISVPEGKIVGRYSMVEALDELKSFLGPGLRRDRLKLE